MNRVEVSVDSSASSDDVWNALNRGESWSDFEAQENNWWDNEDEIDWDTDILSGKKIKTETRRLKPKNVISDIAPNFSGDNLNKSKLVNVKKINNNARKIQVIDASDSVA